MNFKRSVALPVTLLAAIAGFSVVWPSAIARPSAAAGAPQVSGELHDRARRQGSARVMGELRLPSPHTAEGTLQDAAAILGQRRRIAAAQAQLLSRLPEGSHHVVHQYQTAPYLALDV